MDKVRDQNSVKITAEKYTPGLHNLLIKGLVNSAQKDLIHIAGTMQVLLRAQANADYALSHQFGETALKEALRRAESIFVALPA